MVTNYITRNLKQVATIYTRGQNDGYGGYVYTRTTCKCRWEDKQRIFTDKSGQERTSRAVIYTDVDVPLGSFIYLGITTSSTPPATAYEVHSFSKSPNIRGAIFERKVII